MPDRVGRLCEFGWDKTYGGSLISPNKGDNQKGLYHLYRSFNAIHYVIIAYLNNSGGKSA